MPQLRFDTLLTVSSRLQFMVSRTAPNEQSNILIDTIQSFRMLIVYKR